MAQTTVPVNQPAFIPGALATGNDMHATLLRRSSLNGDLEFGIGLRFDASDPEVGADVPSAGMVEANFIGVSVRSQIVQRQNATLAGDAGIAQNQAFDMITQGFVAVAIDEDVAVGDSVFLVILNAGGDTPGHFRSTADGGNTIQVDATLPIRWSRGGTAANGFAVLELNIP